MNRPGESFKQSKVSRERRNLPKEKNLFASCLVVGVVEEREALSAVLRERLRRLRVVLAAVADGAPEVGPHAVAPHRALLLAAHRVPEKVLRAQDPPPTHHLDWPRPVAGQRDSQRFVPNK